ncbi:MAG: hypothetical protein RI907_296 [Pseudomonadota bacterium]
MVEEIVVSEELKAYIDPLTPDEHEALERSLLAEGCRDALVLWGNLLIDGHNRYGICQKHGLPFQTVQHPHCQSMEDVHLWMIDQHLGRRSVSDFQRGVLALRKREIIEERRQRKIQATAQPGASAPADAAVTPPAPGADDAPWDTTGETQAAAGPSAPPLKSRSDIARAARLSANQVVMIEKIQKQAAPEVVAAVKQGVISLNAAAAVASLPVAEQVAAAQAGKDELKQAAKRARDGGKRKAAEPREEAEDTGASAEASAGGAADELQALRERVAALTAENQALKDQVATLRLQLAVHTPVTD